MNYFLLQHNSLYTDIPQIMNMSQHINYYDFYRIGTQHIKSRVWLDFQGDEYTMFPDLLLNRLPLFSDKVRKVINMLYNKIICKEIILVGKNIVKSNQYFLADFKRLPIEAIIEEEDRVPSVLDHSYIKGEDIFYIMYKDKINLVVNLIVLESILRKAANGFIIKEMKVK